ncbi:hydroxyacylglutathione hydrolase [Chitiniphilus purpureus]|uniref:Hydroxyacylglutathione hydrolase n=1 Tax=Chitiniphilus purpureus TaxID=2981137 RepID=A0ABY6DJC8_9NEIS|nr:hydroxyacylglutathione hydrolase [Chitiniphilus sp. CD1]UXY14464.1 hydroxyacylglutathione hydrolase [Chitiniphilus sp. CD1]
MLQLEALPVLEDNYIWVLHDGREALAVDPGVAEPLLAWLARRHLSLGAVLITHHHADHTGGLPGLCAAVPGLPVFGPSAVAPVNRPVGEGACVTLLGQPFQVLAVPGHTLDHLAYWGAPWLFCGDTLFGAGCGRLFEGTAAQLWDSLQRLRALPDGTLVCCAHEYTLTNLRFALTVEPDNPALHARWALDAARRERGEPTLPATLAQERMTNPFLRSDDPAIQTTVGENGPLAVFTRLRERRNAFR